MHAELARAYSLHQEGAAAVATADEALMLAGRTRDAATIVDSLISKSTGLMSLGRYLEAITLLRGALDLAEGRDLARVELRARNNLGTFLFDDDPPASLALVLGGRSTAPSGIGAGGLGLRAHAHLQHRLVLVRPVGHRPRRDRGGRGP